MPALGVVTVDRLQLVFFFVFEVWRSDGYFCAGSDAACYPDVTTYDNVVAHYSFGSEKCCSRVDDHVVPNGGMSFSASDDFSFLIFRKTKRSQSDALIDLHVVANLSGFSNDNACAVVDEEVLSDSCAWVNIDAC